MKKNLLLLLSIFIGLSLSAQIYEQNFDAFSDGDYLAVVDADNWTTWSNAPGTAEDPTISSAFSETAPNSVFVSGTNDPVFSCGDKTSGVYSVNFDMYVPAGKAGYFNLQHITLSEWALEVYFHADLTTKISAGGQEITDVAFAADTWFNIEVDVDMNADWCEVYFDGTKVIEFQWSLKTDGTAGTNQMGCVNVFAGAENSETPEFYFDNFVFEEMPLMLYDENFDGFTANDYLAVVDPDNWTTWSNAPGTAEDPIISDAQAETAPNSVFVSGTNDPVFGCGDYTSGAYSVNFDMYVPAGKAGYFNLQHITLSEWALEVYFHADLTTKISAGGQEITDVAFAADTWFNIKVDVDMDADWCEVYFDGTKVIEFQWSLKTDGTAGTNQIGCVNVFAGAENSETPEFYFDNFQYVSLSSGSTPASISVATQEMTVALDVANPSATETFGIENVGEQDLSYNVYPVYDIDAVSGSATDVLSYSYDNESAVSWINPGVWVAAARYTPSKLEDYLGTKMTSVEVYINDAAADMAIHIWRKGGTTAPGPGEEIYTKAFSAQATSWNTIEIDDEIIIDGDEYWVGYSYFQPAETWVAGYDGGPADPNGDWVRTGAQWFHLSDASLDGNFNIKINTEGDAFPAFMDVPYNMGVVLGGASENVDVDFSAAGLTDGQYTGQLVIASNDMETNYTTIDVTVGVITSIEDVTAKDAVMVYPNPASDNVFVKANGTINQVRISNYLGQLVDAYTVSNTEATISIANYKNGVYFVEITTENAVHTIKIIKK